MYVNTHVGNVDIYAKNCLAVCMEKVQSKAVKFALLRGSACTIQISVDVENAEMQQSSNTIASTIAQPAAAKNAEEMQPKKVRFQDAHTTHEK